MDILQCRIIHIIDMAIGFTTHTHFLPYTLVVPLYDELIVEKFVFEMVPIYLFIQIHAIESFSYSDIRLFVPSLKSPINLDIFC